MRIKISEGEYWWGGIINEGYHMPISAQDTMVLDFRDSNVPDQVMPLMLSNRGRYIWGDNAYTAIIDNGVINIEQEVEVWEGGQNLREAYLEAMKRHFRFSERIPKDIFFKSPQYNTWIELGYEQNEAGILKYAETIVNKGYPVGILMIDEGWAEDYGRFEFKKGEFPNPKEMVKKLHAMGFVVMLWITPYISPDSACFRELEKEGMLLKDNMGNIAIRRWWNGLSAVLDLSNPETLDWFEQKLDWLMEKYSIDGFKFDGGDPNMYRDNDDNCGHIDALEQTLRYNTLGKKYAIHEFRAAWKGGGQSLIVRLSDKKHSWNHSGLNMLLPNSILQGLMGYAFSCPDMIGGGEINDKEKMDTQMDEELFVRYAQAAALCPMMQFSTAPWRVLSPDNQIIVQNAAKLHNTMEKYILEYVRKTVETGEPIMRHMAYEFPDENFECIQDQFMLGEDIMVAPVLQKGQKIRTVVLPKGIWIDDRGEKWEGSQIINIEVPLDRVPYFKKISIVSHCL